MLTTGAEWLRIFAGVGPIDLVRDVHEPQRRQK